MPFGEAVKKLLPHLGTMLPGANSTDGPRPPVVAIFGKHPGWSDHITLPLATPELRHLWQVLYNDGIRPIIERRSWSQLPANNLIPFAHLFLTGQKQNWIVGRMWSSSDKVGRRDYPMVACVDFSGCSPSQAIRLAFPVLKKLEFACRLATRSAQVLTNLEIARNETATAALEQIPPTTVENIATHSDLKDVEQPLLRILFPLSNLMRRGFIQSIVSRPKVTSAAVRVPWCAPEPQSALTQWANFAIEIAGSAYPIFLAVPDSQDWVDLIMGEPGPAELALLRQSKELIPRATDQPVPAYARAFRNWAESRIG